jgi:hypothetical protein
MMQAAAYIVVVYNNYPCQEALTALTNTQEGEKEPQRGMFSNLTTV